MPAGQFRLTMQRGPTPGKAVELARQVLTLGRDASNDVVVNDAEVSRHHARLTRQAGGHVLEDLGSTNGTYVNGERLTGPRALNPGDRVGFGDTVIMLYEAEVADPQATWIGSIPRATPETAYEAPPPPPAEAYAPPPAEAAPPRRGWMPWALAGCGCLLILVCVGVFGGLAYYIDANNLYCEWLGLCF